MAEVNRREKEGGVIPDPDVDTFMKVNISFCNLLISALLLLVHKKLSHILTCGS